MKSTVLLKYRIVTLFINNYERLSYQRTKYIAVEKGVLQGDSFLPLVFELIINTFIQCVKEEKITNFEYRSFKGFLLRSSWMTL